jgi:hypothetical protein
LEKELPYNESMVEMLQIKLTKGVLDKDQLQRILLGATTRQCRDYELCLVAASKKEAADGNAELEAAFRLMGAVCSMMLKLDKPKQPFAPSFVFENIRGAALEDFTSNDLDFLKDLFFDIDDSELKARVGDILWTSTRYYQVVEPSIDAYLETASTLRSPTDAKTISDTESSQGGTVSAKLHNILIYKSTERIERAFQLARLTGNKRANDKIVAYVEAIFDEKEVAHFAFLIAHLMELLLEYAKVDVKKHLIICEQGVDWAKKVQDWPLTRRYLDLKAEWLTIAGELDQARHSKIQAVETYIEEAQQVAHISPNGVTTPNYQSYARAVLYIELGLEALGRVNNPPTDLREKLRKLLLDYQQKSVEDLEVTPATVSVDVSDLADIAVAVVKGKSFEDALNHLTFLIGVAPAKTLKEKVLDAIGNDPLLDMLPKFTINAMGKRISRSPAISSSSSEEKDAAIAGEMFRASRDYWQFVIGGIVEPARRQILLEHNVRVKDFFPMLYNNPFVPTGREQIYARGLHAGLEGDYIVSTHLLIPQIENSLRYLLQKQGIPTTSLKNDGIEDELDLNTLLYKPEVLHFFDEDIIFSLRGLLIDRNTYNARNTTAHGLRNYYNFFGEDNVAIWWLTLRLCYQFIIPHSSSKVAQEDAIEA